MLRLFVSSNNFNLSCLSHYDCVIVSVPIALLLSEFSLHVYSFIRRRIVQNVNATTIRLHMHNLHSQNALFAFISRFSRSLSFFYALHKIGVNIRKSQQHFHTNSFNYSQLNVAKMSAQTARDEI